MCTSKQKDEAFQMHVELTDRELYLLRSYAFFHNVSVERLIEGVAKHYLRNEGPKIISFFAEIEKYSEIREVKK